jgi:hypothetical protein
MILGTLAAAPLAIASLRSSPERGFAIAATILSALEVIFLALVCFVLIFD